ncbi:MAG: phage tail protein I [Hyphomicrobium sp.]
MLPTTYPDLLSPNATAYERALAGATGRLSDIPVPIADLWRWDTCPEEHLPWLAWAMSVDLWNDNWPIERKRNLIRESFDLHRRKGTLYTIERYLRYADATLRKAIVPPEVPYLGTDITEAEREAWLSRFPQIRVYRWRNRKDGSPEAFLGNGSAFDDVLYLGAGPAHNPPSTGTIAVDTFFCVETDAWERYGRRAFLWDKGSHPLATGEETSLRWLESSTVSNEVTSYDHETAYLPTTASPALFCETMIFGDGPEGEFFLDDTQAHNRVVTVRVERSQRIDEPIYVKRTVAPSLEPIDVVPDYVAERGTAHLGVEMFCGQRGRYFDPKTRQSYAVEGFLDGYLMPNDAGERLYERLYLYEAARGPASIDTSFYLNDARLGMPPYNAELWIEVTGRRDETAFGEFIFGYLEEQDLSARDLALDAVVLGKAKRDKVVARTRLHKPISTRDRISTRDGYKSGDLIAIH